MNEEIKIINRLIAEAVIHGADCGGSYDQNTDGLMDAITNWLVFKGIDDKYIARYEDVYIYNGLWEIIQICSKGGD